jgi:hypothetical protein
VCERRESLSPNFKTFDPGINSAIFSQKNHLAKNNSIVSTFNTHHCIVDSVLGTFSIPGIDFPPFNAYKNFACGELRLLDVSGMSHFH